MRFTRHPAFLIGMGMVTTIILALVASMLVTPPVNASSIAKPGGGSIAPINSAGVGQFYPKSMDWETFGPSQYHYPTVATVGIYQFTLEGVPENINWIAFGVATASGDCGGGGCTARIFIHSVDTGAIVFDTGDLTSGGMVDINAPGMKSTGNILGDIVMEPGDYTIGACSDSADIQFYVPFETGSYNLFNFAYRSNTMNGTSFNGFATNSCTGGSGMPIVPPATTGPILGSNDYVAAPGFALSFK